MLALLTVVEIFSLTSFIKFTTLTNGNLKKTVNTVNEQTAVLNFKVNGYLKFNFFNGWNLPLMKWPEKVGTCPALHLHTV